MAARLCSLQNVIDRYMYVSDIVVYLVLDPCVMEEGGCKTWFTTKMRIKVYTN